MQKEAFSYTGLHVRYITLYIVATCTPRGLGVKLGQVRIHIGGKTGVGTGNTINLEPCRGQL